MTKLPVLFRIAFLDDGFGASASHDVSKATLQLGLHRVALHHPATGSDYPIKLRFIDQPEAILAEVSEWCKEPLGECACVLDCDLRSARNSSYASAGGGFMVWRDMYRDCIYNRNENLPYVLIYSAKPAVKELFENIYPGKAGYEFQREIMNPLVVVFAAASDPDSFLYTSLTTWLQRAREEVIRNLNSNLLHQLTQLALQAREVQHDKMCTLMDALAVSTDVLPEEGGPPPAFTLGALFPEIRVKIEDNVSNWSPRELSQSMLAVLNRRLPTLFQLVQEIMIDPISSQNNKYSQSLRKLSDINSENKKLDHMALRFEPFIGEEKRIIAGVFSDLLHDIDKTLSTFKLDQSFSTDTYRKVVNRIASEDNVKIELENLQEQVGRDPRAGKILAVHPLLFFDELATACNVPFDDLVNLFVLKFVKSLNLSKALSYPKVSLFAAFPLTDAAWKIISGVIQHNWERHSQREHGLLWSHDFSGDTLASFRLLIRARTQGPGEGESLDEDYIKARLTAPVAQQKLTELRALVCSQFRGEIKLLTGEEVIVIDSSSVKRRDLADDLDHLEGWKYVNSDGVVGTWYQVEIPVEKVRL